MKGKKKRKEGEKPILVDEEKVREEGKGARCEDKVDR